MSLTTSRNEFQNLLQGNKVVSVAREIFADSDTPVGIYRKLANLAAGSFLLESASQSGAWARYSFVGAGQFGTLTEKNGKAHWQPEPGRDVDAARFLPAGLEGKKPFEALEEAYKHWESKTQEGIPPLASGFVGYLAWETVNEIFEIGPARKRSNTPQQSLSFVAELVIIDHQKGSVVLVANVLNDEPGEEDAKWTNAQERLDELERRLAAPVASPLSVLEDVDITYERVTSEAEFHEMVNASKRLIESGDISQVVVSQRFDAECQANPLDVYRVLRHTNPSPFLYLLSASTVAGDELHIVGSSPEALVTVSDRTVISHPIAGSRPRGATPQEDRELEAELLADAKENLEHEMLVELSKKDLLEVCDAATIKVKGYKRIERFSHVMHIVSTVEGELAAGQNALSALRASFPAGTLSGSPKGTSLEIIDELEGEARGVYGGVAGYFSLSGSADLAIAIRTATITGGRASVQAGAGIVAGSTPEGEDAETRNKAAAPLKAIAVANALKHIGEEK